MLDIITGFFSFESEVGTEKYIVLLYFEIKDNVSCSASVLKHSCRVSIILFNPSLLLKPFGYLMFLHMP